MLLANKELYDNDVYYINTDHIIDVTKIFIEKRSKISRGVIELYNALFSTNYNIIIQEEDFDNIIVIINKNV